MNRRSVFTVDKILLSLSNPKKCACKERTTQGRCLSRPPSTVSRLSWCLPPGLALRQTRFHNTRVWPRLLESRSPAFPQRTKFSSGPFRLATPRPEAALRTRPLPTQPERAPSPPAFLSPPPGAAAAVGRAPPCLFHPQREPAGSRPSGIGCVKGHLLSTSLIGCCRRGMQSPIG